MTNSPEAAFAAVVKKLTPHAGDARRMSANGGPAARAVGKAVVAALAAGEADTQAGCAAFLAALAPAAGDAASLAQHGSGRRKAVASALLAARHDAGTIPWPSGTGAVSVSDPPGDVPSVAGQPTAIRVGLTRDGDPSAAASAGWQITGLGARPISGTAAFAPGAADADAAVTVPADPARTDPVAFDFTILGGPADLVGLTLGEPHEASGRLLPPGMPPAKGVVSFAGSIGTVRRAPAAETVVMVKVRRDNVSTKNPASVPVDVSGLPAGVVQVAPADFKARSQYGYAPFRFSAAGAGLRAADPMTGRADLVATADLDLGADASQTFQVVDGPAPPPSAGNPFHLTGVDLGPLPFLLGFSMGVGASDRATWIKEIGRPPLCASGGSHTGGRTASWQAVRGGDKGAIAKGSQLDIGGTNLGSACGIVQPGSPELLVATWRTVPDNVKESDYADLAGGSHDNDAYIMGFNAWLLMKAHGYGGAQLVVRGDKEYNGGGYGVTAANAPLRAKWLARFIANFDKGYQDAGADQRPRHVLGLAQHELLGPLEAHVPVGPGGQVMVDAIDISAHPASQLNVVAGKPFDEQVAAVREWLRGGYDQRPRYSQDYQDPAQSGLVVAKAHGILISNFETSPRDDGNLACHISAAAWTALFDFWRENAAMVGGVGVYNHTALDRSLAVPGWADGVDALVKQARGGP